MIWIIYWIGKCPTRASPHPSLPLCISVGDDYRGSDVGIHYNLETHIPQLAVKKTKPSKKAPRRVSKSRNIELYNSECVGLFQRHLRSHITTVRRGKAVWGVSEPCGVFRLGGLRCGVL